MYAQSALKMMYSADMSGGFDAASKPKIEARGDIFAAELSMNV